MMMRMRALPGLLVFSLLVIHLGACGDDGGGADSGGSSSTGSPVTTSGPTTTRGPEPTGTTGVTTGSSTSTTETPADTTATAGETTAATTATDGSTGSTSASSTSGSTTEGGMGALELAISSLQVFQDCMPIVAPDPVNATFQLALTNTGDAAASATVSSAAFLDAGGAQAATLEITPAAFGPIAPGDSMLTMAGKVPNSLVPANGCETLQCGQSYTLELVLDVDGVEVIAADAAVVGCVF